VTAPLTLEQRVERIERILGLGEASLAPPLPWALRRSAVMREAARLWGVSPDNLTDMSRIRAFVYPRAAIVMALRVSPAMSYPQIGRVLHRDHSSIINLERIGQTEFARDLTFKARAQVLMELARKPEERAS
jgi:chromosomal replication initiation ATPase DnaA